MKKDLKKYLSLLGLLLIVVGLILLLIYAAGTDKIGLVIFVACVVIGGRLLGLIIKHFSRK